MGSPGGPDLRPGLAALLSQALLVFLALPVRADAPDWSQWTVQSDLEIRNNASVLLPADYTTTLQLDTASLITQGLLRPDCSDLRISWNDGSTENDLPRLVQGCGSPSAIVLFRTQEAIGSEGSVRGYRLLYGNASAGAPLQDPARVYAFYEDFQDGDDQGWIHSEGSWSVVNDGDNFLYRYSGQGSNWVLSYVPLPGVADIQFDAKVRASDSPLTNWTGLAFRVRDDSSYLTFYPSRDANQLRFARIESDTDTITQLRPFTMAGNTWHRMRVRVLGSHLQAKIWKDGDPEPAAWSSDIYDTTFRSYGNIGLAAEAGTALADWDEVTIRKLVDVEPTLIRHWNNAPWWNSSWEYRTPLEISNGSAGTLPEGYSVRLVLDTASLIAAGKMSPGCEDLRITSFDGVASTELDRVVHGCGSTGTEVWFATRRPLASGGRDDGYLIYYGNPSAGPAPADGMNVFVFFEDWERGTDHWRRAGGLDSLDSGSMGSATITPAEWLSPSHGVQFGSRRADLLGDAFSGMIPVNPSTGYAVVVWARSADAAYGPTGYDPFDTGRAPITGAMLWTNEWTIGPQWSSRSSRFLTPPSAAYLEIKAEWWNQSPGMGTLYMDDIGLRYALDIEPGVAMALEETSLPAPTLTNVQSTHPATVGAPATASAEILAGEGSVQSACLDVFSPEPATLPMSLSSGGASDGTWQSTFVPLVAGTHVYRVRAASSLGRSGFSETKTFRAVDGQPPAITLVSITDPILAKQAQTLTVRVTDNGTVSQVSVTVGGVTSPMVQADDLYWYSWSPKTPGTVAYTVTATDTASNTVTFPGSFQCRPRDVDVCTWRDCKPGATSFSIDDGNTNCRTVMEIAGFRGTYYYNGTQTLSWFADYSSAGHEIGSHTATHPCPTPCCYPTCTELQPATCPSTPEGVDTYRRTQLDPNISAIEAGTGLTVESLAWPCGTTDATRMTAASSYVLGARGYFDNTANFYWNQDVEETTPTQFMDLDAFNYGNPKFLDKAITDGKWAIIVSHGGCGAVPLIANRLDRLWAAPVGSILKYIRIRDAAVLTDYARTVGLIRFRAVHNLAPIAPRRADGTPLYPIQFDYPVTLKATLDPSDVVLGVTIDGVAIPYSVRTVDGFPSVLFDAFLVSHRQVAVHLSSPGGELGSPSLSVEKSLLSWTTLPQADSYDVVRGDLGALRSSAGEFMVATQECLANDFAGTSMPFTAVPAAGEGWWFLVRGVNSQGVGSYDTESLFQVRSRDAGIHASSSSCP